MYLKSLELVGFKSFGKKEKLDFNTPISAIVGPNGSGKSNVAEAFRFVLGEQSIKSLRGKKGEDLIFNGGKNAPRANRATVRVAFDNSKKLFNIDFDEVMIERTVHRDGVNHYFINGTHVRLRDIAELLAEANIGASGHHIISQGEADRLLSSSPKDRREMIEDALGLRIYQFKLRESEKKLIKTHENIGQVEALRKEIAPHLKFLQKQIEKLEKTKELRENLAGAYQEYLKREEVCLAHESRMIKEHKHAPLGELKAVEHELEKAKAVLKKQEHSGTHTQEILRLEHELKEVREKGEGELRKLAKLEGQLSFEERRLEGERRKSERMEERVVPLREVQMIVKEVELEADTKDTEVETLRTRLLRVITLLKNFIVRKESEASAQGSEISELQKTIALLKSDIARLQSSHKDIVAQENALRKEYEHLRITIESEREEGREAERAVFTLMSKQQNLTLTLERLREEENAHLRRKEAFEAEIREGIVLVGRALTSFTDYTVIDRDGHALTEKQITEEAPEKQHERKKAIERMKIRLEEHGSSGGEEVLKEFKDVEERDQFLAREIEDLEKSARALKDLIKELEVKLEVQFKEGITKINKAFQEFFAVMFGGGTAGLSLIRETKRKPSLEGELEVDEASGEEEEIEEGIDIHVSLPHKRIKGLVMLSGGERALTSIALLFAMSQVNPPPFLILDETDAALDESNSRRYGDMIENLAKHSQLILITHNRETMSRAQILYGVTMGGDGISKVLSVRFEEAVQVAK